MRLVLTLSALDKAIGLIKTAQDAGKVVERLVVSALEYEALLNCPIGNANDAQAESFIKDNEMFILGVPVAVEPVLPLRKPVTEGAV